MRQAEAVAMKSVSSRSTERRKTMQEAKKENNKFSALKDLKAKRDEKLKKGKFLPAFLRSLK